MNGCTGFLLTLASSWKQNKIAHLDVTAKN